MDVDLLTLINRFFICNECDFKFISIYLQRQRSFENKLKAYRL